jgi:hypothetical protein
MSVSNVSFSLSNHETYLSIALHSRKKSIVRILYFSFRNSRIMAIIRSAELRHSPAACDTKSSSRVTAIIIRSLNRILFFTIIEKVIVF